MKTRIFFLLAAMGLLASCAKVTEEVIPAESDPEISNVKTVLTVGIGTDTKTYLGDDGSATHKVYWSNGDVIAVNGVDSDPLAGLVGDNSSVDFTLNGVLSTPYKAIYPASIYTDATHVTLPAVQTYKAGGFADGMFPMAAYSADGSGLAMHHLCAILKISVLRETAEHAAARSGEVDTDKLVAVKFKGKSSEQVSGEFEINYAATPVPVLVAASGSGADLEVKVAKSQSTSTGTAVDYYIVVPARTYSSGFDIIVKDTNGHIMTKSKESSTELIAGKLYNLTAFEFVPTATEIGVEINSAKDLIDFATAYNDKSLDYYYSGDDVLVATLTDDITFVDSDDPSVEGSWAAFNATGGIGMKNNLFGASEDYYFNGFFNGGGHTISGLEATVPLFAAVGENGHVTGLIIDDSCSFTFSHPNSTELDAGAAVGYHKGQLKDVDVEADVTISAGSISQVTALGGLVGRVTEGTVDNCSYSGNLSVPDGFVVTTQKTYIGGLVGSVTNTKGKVQNSDFEGTIDFAGTVASTSTSDPYLRLGGIVGTVNAGTVSSCEAKGTNTKEITMDNSTAYTATIQNHSRKVYHMVQGGIAGYNAGTVSGCTNGASVKNFVLTKGTADGTASDSNSRYYDVGGIVGLNAADATVTGCTNNGLFESRSTPRIQKIGGIVGYNLGTVSSSSNSSTGDIVIASATGQSPYNLRVGEIGGAIGNNAGTISNIQNAGDITLSRTENNANVEMKFGGVIGLNSAAIDGGVGKNISNSGNIDITYNPVTVTTDGLRFGGIVGSTSASVQNVSNTGNVTYTLSATNVMSKLYMGGIAGEVRNTANVTVSGCENSGEVYFNVNGKAAAHTGDYIGGIIGLVTGEDVTTTVSNCDNSGYVHINCNIGTACTDLIAAGIVGKMGENGSITDCENSNEVNMGITTAAAHTNDYAGGVLGYTDADVEIDNCDNSAYIHALPNNITMTDSGIYVGGIAAWIAGDSSLINCDNTGYTNINGGNNTDNDITKIFADGGIVGVAKGTDEKHITISTCTWEYTSNAVGSRRGTCAGIAAYAEYVDVEDCDVTVDYNMYNHVTAGICGWAVNSSFKNCKFHGTKITASQGYWSAGIVAKLTSGSVVDGCYNYCTDITTPKATTVRGEIAAISETGTTIKNCHHTGTLSICSDTNYTDDGSNVADL